MRSIDLGDLSILKALFDKLERNVLRFERRLQKNSVLLTLIAMTQNKSSKILKESAVRTSQFSPIALRTQIERGNLRATNVEENEVVLTASGIWEVESQLGRIAIESLLAYLQNKHFSFQIADVPLTDVEKVALLSLIAARAFSSDSPMNLLKEEAVRNAWLDIFLASQDFLKKLSIVKKDVVSPIPKGNEHPVSFAMRRLNDLPQKTQHYYCFIRGSYTFYLDLAVNGRLSRDKLVYLLMRIFSRIDSLEQANEIRSFCEDIAYKKSMYVKDDFVYVTPAIDVEIKEALNDLYQRIV